ncbi:unnamed protein product, partial [Ectocarpus sp. 8 AP-2014]
MAKSPWMRGGAGSYATMESLGMRAKKSCEEGKQGPEVGSQACVSQSCAGASRLEILDGFGTERRYVDRWACASSERCRNQTFPCLPEVAANEQDVERNTNGSKKTIEAMT